MRLVTFLFVIAAFSATAISSFAQDFDYSRYKPRTLAEIIELNDEPLAKGVPKLAIVSGDWFHSQVRLRYAGTSRPLSAAHKEILQNWKKSNQISDEISSLFEDEYLFKECGAEHWIAVQKQVARFFATEIAPNQMITVYLFFGGALKTPKSSDFLFLMNEFDATK